MFQISGFKFFLLVVLASSLGLLWYLDNKYYHMEDRILPDPQLMVGENEPPEPSTKNESFKLKQEFVPTNEWQIIGKDQPIPPGLHVQIDLKTGEKKAKLMEGNVNAKTNSLAISHVNKSEDMKESKDLPVNLHKFKSYEELKDDLKKLNLTVTSDMELMDGLSAKFKEEFKAYKDSDNNIRNILTDLEYLLHQVDTAEVFVKNKGIESIIIPCINSNSSYMKAQGALLLGAAASNNQKVQIAALKADIIPLLLKHISDEYEFSVQKNCFFALSTIIRRFPSAQKETLDKNGLKVFISVFKRPPSDLNTKLKVRVSQLLEDLVIEIEDAKLTLKEETNEKLSSEAKERVRQYNELQLKEKLVEIGWCEILSSEFIALSNSLPTNEDSHEIVEASGKSLLAMSNLCKAKLQGKNDLFKSLNSLEVHYKKLFQHDNFFYPLYQLINELANTYDPVLE